MTETIDFLLREMKVGDVFAASISSGAQTEDGKYYTWSEAEIDAALVGTFSARFKQVYGITRDGSVQGRNLPRRLGNPVPANEADEALLAKQRGMLLAVAREAHPPTRDDRVLTDWNGLVITALARAGMVFDKPRMDRHRRQGLRRHRQDTRATATSSPTSRAWTALPRIMPTWRAPRCSCGK